MHTRHEEMHTFSAFTLQAARAGWIVKSSGRGACAMGVNIEVPEKVCPKKINGMLTYKHGQTMHVWRLLGRERLCVCVCMCVCMCVCVCVYEACINE